MKFDNFDSFFDINNLSLLIAISLFPTHLIAIDRTGC